MSDEQTVAIVSFTGALKREVVRIKNKLAKCEKLSTFRIDIEAKGRLDGETLITFKLTESSYGSEGSVEGCNLDDVCEEFLRRKGWVERNSPLVLTANEQQRADAERVVTNTIEDDMPF